MASNPNSHVECAANTTECMLDAILDILDEIRDQNNEYNWDPLTFVFTLIIGIIAIFFTILTIIQALFAAGPGRLKSSRYAIGPWAKYTRRHFDWQELRFRSVSETPVIVFPSESDSRKTVYELVDSSEYQPTGWRTLLIRLGLDDPEHWGRKGTGADHLPQELPAVPAYGTVAAIMALAILEGKGRCDIIPGDDESPYVKIRGNGFQLRVQNHPLLGPVASFETYLSTREKTARFQTGYIDTTMRHARGYVAMNPEKSKERNSPPNGDPTASWILLVEPKDCAKGMNLATDSLYEARRQGERILNVMEIAEREVIAGREDVPQTADSTCTCAKYQSPECCSHFQKAKRCGQKLTSLPIVQLALESRCPLGLMICSRPPLEVKSADDLALGSCPTSIFNFPSAQAKLHEKAQILVLQSRFWSVKHSTSPTFTPRILRHWAFNPAGGQEHLVSWPSGFINSPANTKNSFVLIREAYDFCVKFLRDGKVRETVAEPEVQLILLTQLLHVDDWLQHNASRERKCRQLTISAVTAIMYNIVSAEEVDAKRVNENVWKDAACSDPKYPAVCRFTSPTSHQNLRAIIVWFERCSSTMEFSVQNGIAKSGALGATIDELESIKAALLAHDRRSKSLDDRSKSRETKVVTRDTFEELEQLNADYEQAKEQLREVNDMLVSFKKMHRNILQMRHIPLMQVMGLGDGDVNLLQDQDSTWISIKIMRSVKEMLASKRDVPLPLEEGDLEALDYVTTLEDILLLVHRVVKMWEVSHEVVNHPLDVFDEEFVVDEKEFHPLDDMFIFRALLMAALLSQSVDTSELLRSDIYQQIIPFL